MTLRRFYVLVRGLGPQSAIITSLAAERYMGDRRVWVPNTEAEAERAADMLFGTSGQKPQVH